MAKEKKQPKRRSGGSIITKVLILAILVAIGVQRRSLHVQVRGICRSGGTLTGRSPGTLVPDAGFFEHRPGPARPDREKLIRKEKQYTIWSFR